MRAAVLAASLVPAIATAAEVPVWFGTYTNPTTRSEGIYVARFDTATGSLTKPVLAGRVKNPSFLAFHPRLPMLYAVSEIAAADGTPGGVDPDGSVVLAANYGGGSVACLGLTKEGRLRPLVSGSAGSGLVKHRYERDGEEGIDPKRQDKPHAHSVDVLDGLNRVVACDLGLDQVLMHQFSPETATVSFYSSTKLTIGSGPRHFALHPDSYRAWCVNELDLTVTGLHFGPRRCGMATERTYSTLPPDVTDRTGFSCAEIAVHPGGRFLYASNRGHDSIAMFRIIAQRHDQANSTDLEFLGTEPTRAKTPRHFAIAPGGTFLLAAGQASNTVTVFSIDEATGRLMFTGTSVEVPSPVCVGFRR